MSVHFSLAGEGASVRVSITRYERTEFTAEADADWLVAEIDVASDGFTAAISGAVRSEDFQDFGRELSYALVQDQSVAEFRTLEDILRLTVSLSRIGRGTVSGVVRSLDKPKN